MKEAEARLRFGAARVARLATVSAADEPHLVPIVFILDGDLIYSLVDAKPKRPGVLRRLANIAVNPRVTVLVDEYDDEWERLWWVRVDGTARVEVEGSDRERAIELLRAKYPQYQSLPGPFGPAIVVRVDRWSSWSFS